MEHITSDIYLKRFDETAISLMGILKGGEKGVMKVLKRIKKTDNYLLVQVITTDVEGWTFIHACVLRSSKKIIKYLLNTGVPASFIMGQPKGLPEGCSLLHIAAIRGDISICKLLVSKGADVNATDGDNVRPVHYAMRHYNDELLNFFLTNGADLNSHAEKLTEWRKCASMEALTPQASTRNFCFFK